MKRASCRGDTTLHHRGAWSVSQQTRGMLYERAKEMCRTCPVLRECAVYALSLPETEGIFAGADPVQLRRHKASGKGAAALLRVVYPAA